MQYTPPTLKTAKSRGYCGCRGLACLSGERSVGGVQSGRSHRGGEEAPAAEEHDQQCQALGAPITNLEGRGYAFLSLEEPGLWHRRRRQGWWMESDTCSLVSAPSDERTRRAVALPMTSPVAPPDEPTRVVAAGNDGIEW